MKNALIDPTTSVTYMSGWTPDPVMTNPQRYNPVFSTLPDSARVADVADNQFPVAPPLFWADCADDVVADQWYYDTANQQILVVPSTPPYPGEVTNGLQTP